MRVTGLITEYNPFHKGHEYHIQEAKKITGADYVIAIMSGDYVQRGTPACVQKHTRAHMALVCGVDLVLELPLPYATGTAERFAEGSVSILDKLGVVDSICFGSECGNAEPLMEIAHILAWEPKWYQTRLQKYLREGLSFPSARAASLPEYADILNSPNNILGIEYCKAIIRSNSKIKAISIQRKGSTYHDEHLSCGTTADGFLPSATALRNRLRKDTSADFTNYIPTQACRLLDTELAKNGFMDEDDFSSVLLYKLLQAKSPEEYLLYEDVSEELASRIFKYRLHFQSFSQFADLLKTKEITRTRINRALLHMILDIKKEHKYELYARILGFRKDAGMLLSQIKEQTRIPFFSKTAAAKDLMSDQAFCTFETTLAASVLYQGIASQRNKIPIVHEHSKPIIIV